MKGAAGSRPVHLLHPGAEGRPLTGDEVGVTLQYEGPDRAEQPVDLLRPLI